MKQFLLCLLLICGMEMHISNDVIMPPPEVRLELLRYSKDVVFFDEDERYRGFMNPDFIRFQKFVILSIEQDLIERIKDK